MIRDIYIAALGDGEDGYTEPPARELNLSVIGGNAHLAVVPLDGQGNRLASEGRDLVVPAQALASALDAAIASDQTPTPSREDHNRSVRA